MKSNVILLTLAVLVAVGASYGPDLLTGDVSAGEASALIGGSCQKSAKKDCDQTDPPLCPEEGYCYDGDAQSGTKAETTGPIFCDGSTAHCGQRYAITLRTCNLEADPRSPLPPAPINP